MPRIRLHPSGHVVDCAPGSTVLGALENAGYALPNNCRAGACGECKVRVLSGHFDQGTVLDMALSDAERQAGYGLMCMAKPKDEEIVIEWGTADAQPRLFPPRENQLFVLTDRIARTARIVELRLRPVGTPMRYWPGQYVMLGDERAGVPPRSYSIAGAPRPDGEISLQVTRVDEGLTSTWIHDRLRTGDRVKLAGPYGTFIGDPSVDTPVLCLGAGSGLAPLLSLTEAALRRGFRRPVTLLFSARTSADLYDDGLMKFWLAKHRNFNYRTTLTREPGPDLCGRIPQVLPRLFPDLSGHSVFVAGAPPFVDDCVHAVRALGAPAERIHTEGYYSRAAARTPQASRLVPVAAP